MVLKSATDPRVFVGLHHGSQFYTILLLFPHLFMYPAFTSIHSFLASSSRSLSVDDMGTGKLVMIEVVASLVGCVYG